MNYIMTFFPVCLLNIFYLKKNLLIKTIAIIINTNSQTSFER